MPRVTFLTGGEERVVDALPGKTLAETAELNDMKLYGACRGASMCCQCSRRIVEGLTELLRKGGQPYGVPEGAAPIVRTCQAVPGADTTVDCDSRGRF